MPKIKFGWAYPSIEIVQSAHVPHSIHEHGQILPTVVEHFDSLWMVDHLFGFDHAEDPVLESYASTEDPETGQLTPFFDPRRQEWADHFRLEGSLVVPLTPEGRVTVAILQLNHPDRVLERRRLIQVERYS